MTYESPTRAARASQSTHEPASAQALDFMRNIFVIIAGSLFIAVCAHIRLPLDFTPVPFSLQDFAVMALGLMVAPRLAMFTTLAYLAAGAAGLPVFAPGPMGLTGVARIVGPTGGYLMAYPTVAVVCSYLWRNGEHTFLGALVSAGAGNLLLLTLGCLWMGLNTHVSVDAVIAQGAMPFLPGDAIKIVLAGFVGYEWSRMRPAQQKALPIVQTASDLE